MKTKLRLLLSLLFLLVSCYSLNAATAVHGRPPASRGGGGMRHSFGGGSFRSPMVNFSRTPAMFYLSASSLYGLHVASIPDSRYMFYYNDGIFYLADGIIYSESDEGGYEIVKPEIGMIIPELPEVNVNTIEIDNKIYFEFDNMIYKQIPTQEGLMYEVIGILEL